MNNHVINIGAASNERYFPGLYVLITSILKSSKTKKTIAIHVIDGGISDSSWSKLQDKTIQISSNCILYRHQLDLDRFEKFPKDFGGGVLAYARLLFPEILLNETHLVYFDVDILVMKDVEEIWDIDLQDKIMTVVADPLMTYVKEDTNVHDLYGVPGDSIHFNTGVVKMDLVKWRNEEVTNKTIQYISKHPDQCKYWDQSALNIVLYNKVLFIDSSFNYFAELFNVKRDVHKKYNIHYLMKNKPWLHYHKGVAFELFYITLLNTNLLDKALFKQKKLRQFAYLIPELMVVFYVLLILSSFFNRNRKSVYKNNCKFWWAYVKMRYNVYISYNNYKLIRQWKFKIV